MHSALYHQPNAQYQLYMNIKGVSPSCFSTSILSLGRKCHFLGTNCQRWAIIYKVLQYLVALLMMT